MKFKDFLETNNTTLVKEYLKGVFSKSDITLNDLYIALGDVSAQNHVNLAEFPLSDFVKTAAKRNKTTNVLKSSLETLKTADQPMTAQEIAVIIGADADYTRNKLMEESKRDGTKLLVTYPNTKGVGRPTPYFQIVKTQE